VVSSIPWVGILGWIKKKNLRTIIHTWLYTQLGLKVLQPSLPYHGAPKTMSQNKYFPLQSAFLRYRITARRTYVIHTAAFCQKELVPSPLDTFSPMDPRSWEMASGDRLHFRACFYGSEAGPAHQHEWPWFLTIAKFQIFAHQMGIKTWTF